MSEPAASLLLERDREKGAIQGALDGLAAGHGSLLLIEGPAGIGKTRILAEGARLAEERSLRMRSARGGELERGIPFGVARQLFEPVLERASEEERRELLAGSAGLARIALGQAVAEESAPGANPFAPIHGLYWLVANLAERVPLVLTVDDAQWADPESLRWLDYLARRLPDLAVAVVLTVRTGEPDEPPELEALRMEAEAINPTPLTKEAVTELLAAQIGAKPATELAEACATATGGNPFLLTEVLRVIRDARIEPERITAQVLAGAGTENVARYVLQRVGGFGHEAVALARAIAVLGESPQLRHAAALAGLDEKAAAKVCDLLRTAEVLTPGQPLRFVHPLVRAAIYGDIPDEDLSASHREAASILASTGLEARLVAPHLMACLSRGDQWVVGQLRSGAEEAMARGAPDAARRYLERALEEPPDDKPLVEYELGRALWGADPLRAPQVLEQVAEEADDPVLRLNATADTAWTYFDAANLAAAVEWFGRFADEVPDDEDHAKLAAEASLLGLRMMSAGRNPATSRRARQLVARAGRRTRGEVLIRTALAFDSVMACEPAVGAVELTAALPPPPWTGEGHVPALACKALAWCGRWPKARDATLEGWSSAESSGLLHVVSYRESLLAEIDRLAGRLLDSEAEARTAWDIVSDLAPVSLAAWSAITNLIATLTSRGNLEEAATLAGERDLSAPLSVIPMTPVPLEIRGVLRLARGQLADGVDDLLTLGEDLESFGVVNPAPVPWRQEVVPALATLDRTAEAKEIIALGEERARRFGAAHVIGGVLRARGLIEPRARQIETLRQSVACLEEYGPPHELARSLVELGAALRRAGQRSESREPLRQALELAVQSGAGGTGERAREELAAAGSRPRSVFRTGVASLTASELRTARLAAEGLGNVEIAQRLFVTRKTVEKHLSNAYSKLEISSREELEEALELPTAI